MPVKADVQALFLPAGEWHSSSHPRTLAPQFHNRAEGEQADQELVLVGGERGLGARGRRGDPSDPTAEGRRRSAHGDTGSVSYVSVVIRGSKGDTLDPSGTLLEHFTLTAGSVYWYGDEDLPETHALRNAGDDEILIVTTELL